MSRGFLEVEDGIKAPVLGHPDFKESFKFKINASREGLGAVFSQQQDGRKKVIAYASLTLRMAKGNMRNYCSLKLELLDLQWAATEKFRSYLLGHRFDVFTDINPLTRLETAKFGATERRWIAENSAVGDMTTHFKSENELSLGGFLLQSSEWKNANSAWHLSYIIILNQKKLL